MNVLVRRGHWNDWEIADWSIFWASDQGLAIFCLFLSFLLVSRQCHSISSIPIASLLILDWSWENLFICYCIGSVEWKNSLLKFTCSSFLLNCLQSSIYSLCVYEMNELTTLLFFIVICIICPVVYSGETNIISREQLCNCEQRSENADSHLLLLYSRDYVWDW